MAVTIQIVGPKDSGKTAVVTRLIGCLTKKHFRVAAIKHDAHSSSMDIPGTDSYQMSAAGARQVVLESNNQLFFHQQGQRPSLAALVRLLGAENDFVIIEGHKAASYPKVVLIGDDKANNQDFTAVITAPVRLVQNAHLDTQACDHLVQAVYNYLISQMGDQS